MTAQVIPFQFNPRADTSSTRVAETPDLWQFADGTIDRVPFAAAVVREDGENTRLTSSDLYSSNEIHHEVLGDAFRLLDSAASHISTALERLHAGQEIASDDEFQRLSSIFPKLFCCRTLGDGFGTVVNGTWAALENLGGVPPSERQIVEIGVVLRKIRNEPFLTADSATDLLIKLEEQGLVVEPTGFDALADWLSG